MGNVGETCFRNTEPRGDRAEGAAGQLPASVHRARDVIHATACGGRAAQGAKRILQNLALFAVSVTVALLVAEALSRWLTEPVRGVSWYHYDTRYGFRHRSDAEARTNTWGDGKIWSFETNARGFRGEDWPDDPPRGGRRVLVTGDSFTFGNGVEHEEAFPRVADTLLRASAGGWEILNLGVSAWGPSNAVAWLETEGAPIGASCLVYGLFAGNDVMDNVVYKLFDLRDGELIATPQSISDESMQAYMRSAVPSVPFYDFLLKRSQLFNLVRLAAMHPLAPGDPANQHTQVDRQNFEKALLLNRALLDHMAALAHERFGGFGVVVIPTRRMLSNEVGSEDYFPLWIGNATREDVLDWAGDAQVPVLDLLGRLPRKADEVRQLFFERDFHNSIQGNRRIGELVAEELPRLCTPASATSQLSGARTLIR
jgi:hypothetical protein